MTGSNEGVVGKTENGVFDLLETLFVCLTGDSADRAGKERITYHREGAVESFHDVAQPIRRVTPCWAHLDLEPYELQLLNSFELGMRPLCG